ncbi:ATPase AAA [Spirochaetia bacterium]|nr:ATPase AAA [Spirochaetia bacterium]
MKRRLPIGIQDFPKIREGGFSYVDKTERIHDLISGSGGCFFLSRPRRFGKSLLCSTLGAIFEGRRELFGEIAGQTSLAIDSLDWDWKRRPVIRLDLNAGLYSEGPEALRSVLARELKREAEKQEMLLGETDVITQFTSLIQKSCDKTGEKAVIIIDEYDKPLLSTIDLPDIHKEIRDMLKGFYGVLKSYDAYLKFVFLTGVTKFAHVSVFSDLNHLIDLTLDPRYADICGITQEELEQNFVQEIESVLQNTGKSRNEYLDELRRFYNGYRFSRKPLTVYNPFGLLNHFDKSGEFLSYWYQTGTPTFLVKLIAGQKINIIGLNNLRVGYDDFSKYDAETMKAVPLLYQSGYLTIADYDEESNQFILDYPNEEVRASFAKSLIEHYLQPSDESTRALYTQLPLAFFRGNVEGAINAIEAFLSSIPYDLIRDTENYFHTVTHLIFTMLGMNCRSELRIAQGRIDTLVETKNFVYCFEFKLNGTAEEALAQIDTKDYLLPWTGAHSNGGGKKLFKIGVVFNTEKRIIGEWKALES